MTDLTASILSTPNGQRGAGARIAVLLILAVTALGLAWFWEMPDFARKALIAAGASTILVTAWLALRLRRQRGVKGQVRDLLSGFIEKDATPSFVTDDDGLIQARNLAASERFSGTQDQTLAATLRAIFGNPSAVLYRLQVRSRLEGNAREDIVTRRGHIRLSVHTLGSDAFLWRVEDISDRSAAASRADTLPLPMLTIGRGGAILFMNEAARSFIGSRVKSLDRLFVQMPYRVDEINHVTVADGAAPAIIVELASGPGRQELFLIPVKGKIEKGHSPDFATLPVAMMRLSPTGRILDTNRMAQDLIGGPVEPDTSLEQLMQGLGRPIPDWLSQALDETAAPRSEFLRLSGRDREVFVQVTLSPITNHGEKGLIAVLNDATELKTLEAQFVQSQKMQAVGQLAGGVAHDFNNLLTAISGHCDLLLLRHDHGDPDYGDLVQINQNANRAAALVSQLLAFSRKQTLRPEVLDLRDTLSDLIHLLNRLVGEKVTLTLSHDPALKSVRADKRQLEQVLMNLVVNARDAMPKGGEIRIETEVITLNEPLERDRATLPGGEYVTVKVRDEGIGIEPNKLQKIFEPFYTTKRTGEGTGLGLSTVYGIVKQTGGYIFVDSVLGKGTEFTLYFPAFQARQLPPAPEAVVRDKSADRYNGGVVLLVEDEAPVRAFASRALRLRGYTVLEADSAEDALRLLEDPDLTVDVFVTDVVMPGLDGPTWVRQALAERPQVRVVFVSGYSEGAFGDSEADIPNSVFLPKPFSLNQLTETVQQQLH
ncbi:ATP-binding protein [Ruegeria sp. PrR005]